MSVHTTVGIQRAYPCRYTPLLASSKCTPGSADDAVIKLQRRNACSHLEMGGNFGFESDEGFAPATAIGGSFGALACFSEPVLREAWRCRDCCGFCML